MIDRLGFVVSPVAGDAPNVTAVELDPIKGGDVYKWALEQSAHLLAKRFDKVDIVNVADEIESLGRSEYRSLAGNLEVVLTHMLKWDYQPQRRSRSWIRSIEEHRERAALDPSESPSLKARIADALRQGIAWHATSRKMRRGLRASVVPRRAPMIGKWS